MPIALDGHAHATGSGAGLTVTLTTTQSNDVIILFVEENGFGSISGVTDDSGVTQAWQQRPNTASGFFEWWTTASAPLSGATITVTLPGSSGFIALDAFGISGTAFGASPLPFDNANNVSSNVDPLTISTTNPNTMVIGGFRENAANNPTAGSGFTQISGADFLLSEYQLFASPQTNLSVTQNPAAGSNGCIADAIVAANPSDWLTIARRRNRR